MLNGRSGGGGGEGEVGKRGACPTVDMFIFVYFIAPGSKCFPPPPRPRTEKNPASTTNVYVAIFLLVVFNCII